MTTRTGDPIEWVCGLDPDPSVSAKGLARPFIVVWLRDGVMFDTALLEPTLTAERIVGSFLATTRAPRSGEPHVPDRVRVASPEVAEMLRAGVGPGVEVVCAPTPELAALQQQMAEKERRRVKDDGSGETYLGKGVSVAAVSQFFGRAAGLYRAAPWERVPADHCLIGVTCEKLGIDGAVVSVMGQEGTGKGVLIFWSHQVFLEYMATDFAAKETVRVPPYVSLTYERGADLAPQRRKEVALHGFEVADAHAYPELTVLEDVLPRAPDDRDLEVVGAILSALKGLVEVNPNLAKGWSGKGSIHTFGIQTVDGKVEMTLSVPHDAAEALRQGRMKEVRRVEKKR